MKVIKSLLLPTGFGLLLVLLAAAPAAAVPTGADATWRTPLTISEPTEIPGTVLQPGKYEVQVLNTKETRMVVQFSTVDPPAVVATVIAIPDYRVKTSESGQFTYFQRFPGSLQALRSWVYPGNNFGVEFVYSKEEAIKLAQGSKTEVYAAPSARPEPTEPIVMISPGLTEVPLGEYNLGQPKTAEAETAKPLPATASNLPLLALMGLGALCAAAALRGLRAIR